MGVTLGIDLASQPRNTAVCAIAWGASAATVTALWCGTDAHNTPLHDRALLSLMRGDWSDVVAPCVDKVAIDAPFGWPIDFVRAVNASTWPLAIDSDRRRLERRATDHWIHERTGKQPLSVSTDRIAYPAMRLAGILAGYTIDTNEPIDRTGLTGRCCEAYPDPAIRRLGLWPHDFGLRDSYKGDGREAVRAAIVSRLTDRAPWLRIDSLQQEACVASDDCLDALICALVARAAQLGLVESPPEDLLEQAATEGWITLPHPDVLERLAP